MSFDYILRYYIDPGFNEDDRIVELIEFCHAAKVTEVMLFLNPEELYCGYQDRAALEKWLSMAAKAKKALNAQKITMSVNPWATTAHVSRGRKFGPEQSMIQPLVGENGVVSQITSCPLDKEWQRQLGDLFAEIASRIAPTAIWIEDDWRLHNHEPEMNYGGCCCPLHLKRFSELAGREVGREELLANVLAPGKPHPWRKMWLDLCRDTMLEPARSLEQRVHAANPDVQLALMSSNPDIHSIEGRDWAALAKAFSPERPLMLRPHLPPYTETRALTTAPSVTRQTIACAPEGTRIYPELENSPRSGRYSKSAAYSSWECLQSACYGSCGITINHYDMMGNGISLDPGFHRALTSIKPRLDALAALNLNDRNSEGVDVLSLPDAAYHANSSRNDSFYGLHRPSCLWSDTFYILGVSHRIATELDPSRVVAVSGQTANAMSDDLIMKMLSGRALIDAEASEILLQRGYGELTGVKSAEWGSLNNLGYAYEEIASGDEGLYGLKRPRMSAQRCGPRLWRVAPSDGAEELTIVRKFDHSEISPGMLKFRNRLGGTAVTLAYTLGEGQFFVGFFNEFRRKLIQQVLRGMGAVAAMGERFPMHVYRCRHANGVFAAFINSTPDVMDRVEFQMDGVDLGSAEALAPDGSWEKANLQIKQSGGCMAMHQVLPLEALFLNFKS